MAAGADEFLHEVGEPFAERHALGARALAPRELLHVADDRADALGVGPDDVAHAAVRLGEARVLAEELRRVADRADGVADLVGDRGRKPAERGQPRLVDAVVERGQVLEEDQHRRRMALAERREMRAHFAQAVDGEQVAADRVGPGALCRHIVEQVQQARRNLAEQRVRRRVAAEDLACRLVDEADAVLLVDDHEALAQPLDDVLRQLREVREVEVALAHQRLALAQAPGERRDRERGDQDHAAEQSRLRQVRGIGHAR